MTYIYSPFHNGYIGMKYLSRIFLLAIIFLLFLVPRSSVLGASDNTSNPYYYWTTQDIMERVIPSPSASPEVDQNRLNAPRNAMMTTRLEMTSLSSTIACVAPIEISDQDGNRYSVEELQKQYKERCGSQDDTALGNTSNLIMSMYQKPPASLAWYIQDLAQSAGLAKAANAQGIGFSGLQPLLPLWKVFRDISYIILVAVMVIIGFMIIFRMKLDPKTVISIQAALPKIILTLLLITFSYAIAGFLIDLMYVSMALIITIMGEAYNSINTVAGTAFVGDVASQQTAMLTADVGDLFTTVFSVGMTPAALIHFFGGSIGNLLIYFGSSQAIGAVATATIFQSVTGTLPVFLVGFGIVTGLVLLIVLLGLLFTFIRLFFLLLNSYIQILIAVILAPLFLIQEAIPGRSAFSEWVLNLVANLSVFPATVAIIYLSWIFTSAAWGGKLWGPPFIGGPLTDSGASGSDGGNPMALILGLGIMFMSPNLVAAVKKALHAKPALPISAGTALSPLSGAVGSTMGTVQQFYYPMQIMREAGPLKDAVQGFTDRFKKSA